MQDFAGAAIFVGMVFAVFFGGGFDDLLDLQNGFVGGEERDIVGEPDVEKRKILDIVGEELRFELMGEKAADNEKNKRAGEDQPAMIDGGGADAVVEAAEASGTALFGRFFNFLSRTKEVVAEERDESH